MAIIPLSPERWAQLTRSRQDPRHEPIPKDWPVKPLKPSQRAVDRATCGHCGLSWDDGFITEMTPAPSARCPFEPFHVYADEPPA